MKPARLLKNCSVIDKILWSALKEDIGKGDITSKLVVPKDQEANFKIIARENGILAGGVFVKRLFRLLSPEIKIRFLANEGAKIKKNEVIAIIKGNARKILMGERVALNILCRLSGIATLTRKFLKKITSSGVQILDTRKTTPNLRLLEKYAVTVGGGKNHRFGLYDMILIKDNHIKLAGGLSNAIKKIPQQYKTRFPFEVEVKNITELKEALALNVPWIMLDNMKLKEIRKAVKLTQGRAKLEVSGGVNLKTIKSIAKTGVNYISIGALTHSAPIIDMAMKVDS
jgi:nicotinate-nucleotide pyrophosphorylase (carboxylating)